MSKNSRTWNWDPFAGAVMVGVAGAGPGPVIVSVRTADQAESANPTVPPTVTVVLTLQKYVPFGKPLTRANVGIGVPSRSSVNPEAATIVNDDVVPSCQV